ncbi:alpha/beta hydrolase [Proteus vulgaris]|uniref:alpha/beta hydrolase n=2 Tax=Proteus faecis TaxID=2050967 RepID=UPI00163BA47A|nr:alpha/beta hydrolase [Proteus vulgaris]
MMKGNILLKFKEYTIKHYFLEKDKLLSISESTEHFCENAILYNIKKPIVTVVQPYVSNKHGIIIIPGGGYRRVVYGIEGLSVAKWFASKGYTSFILSYRMPDFKINSFPFPFIDAFNSLQFIKRWEEKQNIKLNSVGVMGFSAGGHIASNLVIQCYLNKVDINIKPDYLALVYPVISMQKDIAHLGCKFNLIGNSSKENIYSAELNIPEEMPPVFIIHSIDDTDVSFNHSYRFFMELYKKKLSVDLHLFEKGGHGFGISELKKTPSEKWKYLFLDWFEAKKF